MHSQVMHCTERFTQYEHGFFFSFKKRAITTYMIIELKPYKKKERKHCM